MRDTALEDLLRSSAPQVLGAVVRRYGHFDLAEDAVQEALLAAATQWPDSGTPDDPRAWLVTVASRRLTDLLRSEQARRRREDAVAQWASLEDRHAPGVDVHPQVDDTLVLLFLCCHPSLTPASQVALALRAVGGLTTGEIARAFLVSEDTMTRRITRAKKRIESGGEPFRMPAPEEWADRSAAVLHVLYLIFTEGYAATAGPHLVRLDLSSEAIRLTRIVHRSLPSVAETAGLLALMLLTDARRAARVGAGGTLIPMSEQDRSLWRRDAIAEGTALVTDALRRGDAGPYQVQAAIAAVHARATCAEETEWSQIVRLYEILLRMSENPIVALNHAVAVAMARGPAVGLDLLATLAADDRVSDDRRFHAVRAHLLEMTGDDAGARKEYDEAARRATSLPQQRYLRARAERLG
ncbi:RNA polymerase sigma factor [Rhodococcus sp. NPDC060090]|uniref:RNA polymerase sigma factor n=1 Tax=Rhodococcus sp. NPDC060090 TaxID=3347056 RepID=UPI00365BBE63